MFLWVIIIKSLEVTIATQLALFITRFIMHIQIHTYMHLPAIYTTNSANVLKTNGTAIALAETDALMAPVELNKKQ